MFFMTKLNKKLVLVLSLIAILMPTLVFAQVDFGEGMNLDMFFGLWVIIVYLNFMYKIQKIDI